MQKYKILREDYGDEDREIIVYDVYDIALKTIVFSSYDKTEAENWIDSQRAIDYRMENKSYSPFEDSQEYHEKFA
jgi:hypothetical protein